jgi:hypothetical protein
MLRPINRTRDYARILLALIRLFNGLAALFAPRFLAQRLGVDTDANPAALYIMRMFGIRTVLIGIDLLRKRGQERTEVLRHAVLIHASDTLAAFLAARTGRLPAGAGRLIVGISAVNTLLAVLANR